MKKIIYTILFICMFLFSGIVLEGNANALTLVYEEDFSSGSLPSNSVIIDGSWSIEDNYLHAEPSSSMYIDLSESIFSRPLRIEAKVRFRGPEADEFVVAFLLGSEQYNIGYRLDIDTGWHSPKYVNLLRADLNANVPLASSDPVNFRDGEWHTVALELLEDGSVKGFYDAVEKLSVVDSTYNDFNFLYFSANNSAYDWDDLKIYSEPIPEPENYYIHWFDVSTRTFGGSAPTTYFWFLIRDANDGHRPPYRNIVQSATIILPDSTEIQTTPDFISSCHSEVQGDDKNRNGIIEIDQGELEGIVRADPEYEIISPVTPHDAGDYTLQVTLENGQVLTQTINVPEGLNAVDWPPVTDLQANMDSQTGELQISWTLPAFTFPEEAQIRFRIEAYQSNGDRRYIRIRMRNLPGTLTNFTFTKQLADFLNNLGVEYFKLQVRVYSEHSVNVASSEIKEYAIDGYSLTPATIPTPSFLTQEEVNDLVAQAVAAAEAAKQVIIDGLEATINLQDETIALQSQQISELEAIIDSMYTQEQLDQAIEAACPGNSENPPGQPELPGRPESPGNSDPPGLKK